MLDLTSSSFDESPIRLEAVRKFTATPKTTFQIRISLVGLVDKIAPRSVARTFSSYYRGVRRSTSTGVGAIATAVIAAMAASCGSGTPTSPAAGHAVIATVMLESTGPNPREITIGVGETVSFMNHEGVPYTVSGGAGPSQSACPEINV